MAILVENERRRQGCYKMIQKRSGSDKYHWLVLLFLSFQPEVNLWAIEYAVEHIATVNSLNIDVIPVSDSVSKTEELMIVSTDNSDDTKGLPPNRKIEILQNNSSAWRLKQSKNLESKMQFIDSIRTPAGVQIIGYQDSSVFLFDRRTAKFNELFANPSIFRTGRDSSKEMLMSMSMDVNGDNLDDIIMPNFDGWHLSVQQSEGFKSVQKMGPPPVVRYQNNRLAVGYSAQTPFLIDENNDNKTDLAFWNGKSLSVYRQSAANTFSETPTELKIPIDNLINSYTDLRFDEDDTNNNRNQSKLLENILDINADGVEDLLIKTIASEGIFGWESQYQIHFGRIGPNNRLKFATDPSTEIVGRGYQFGLEHADIAGDGKKEFVSSSAKITIAALIRGLISRSVKVDFSVYRLDNDRFPKTPAVEKTVSAKFDFSSGETFIPATLTADITGDGREDLLLQQGKNTLLIYKGNDSSKLFSRKPLKLTLDLPKTGTGILVHDLDHDGRDELILKIKENASTIVSVVRFNG